MPRGYNISGCISPEQTATSKTPNSLTPMAKGRSVSLEDNVDSLARSDDGTGADVASGRASAPHPRPKLLNIIAFKEATTSGVSILRP